MGFDPSKMGGGPQPQQDASEEDVVDVDFEDLE